MADMATLTEVEVAWEEILKASGLTTPSTVQTPTKLLAKERAYLVPVTYMNSSADLKDFVGRHGGVVCTSSNAEGVLNWAFERAGPGGAVLFFPDQHLGHCRTCDGHFGRTNANLDARNRCHGWLQGRSYRSLARLLFGPQAVHATTNSRL